MDPYIVSARKYRPTTFDSVVGQKALTGTLKNAVATGRLAQSYLFCGSRGVGKTSCARIFAKAINCQNRTPEGEPCNECDSCKAFNRGTSMNIIELDAASNNSVDDIRELVSQVQVPPSTGKYRVFIVDEVHMLSSSAFNAFLKTLEEPPGYVVFILATTEKHKIIPTILSRCQIYDFHRITINDMVEHLAWVAEKEGVKAETAALGVIAKKADGAMRDALSIFDQVVASTEGNVSYAATIDNLNVLDDSYYNRIFDAAMKGDPLEAWIVYSEVRDKGFDSHFFINGLADYFRNLMVASDSRTVPLLETDSDSVGQLIARAKQCSPGFLYKAMNLCNEADLHYRTASNKQFLIELTLAKICQSVSPSPNKGSDGEGQLKPIAAASRSTDAAVQNNPVATPVSMGVKPVTPHIPRQATKPIERRMSDTQGIRKNIISGPKININRKDTVAPTEQKEIQKPQTLRNESYSAAELSQAWDKYIEQHAKERILINTMRMSRPISVGENRYRIEVENDIQLEALKGSLESIKKSLADSLKNDNIVFEAAVRSGEPMRHVLNDRELLAEMIKETPVLSEMMEVLKLKLS
ncbi:MAG: DNA polymerase III subunit gamma/tau [Paramuribaculum sp.]|nr:DNA polymerase III subunit gamma/tau [Paramuribaculum sp.]